MLATRAEACGLAPLRCAPSGCRMAGGEGVEPSTVWLASFSRRVAAPTPRHHPLVASGGTGPARTPVPVPTHWGAPGQFRASDAAGLAGVEPAHPCGRHFSKVLWLPFHHNPTVGTLPSCPGVRHCYTATAARAEGLRRRPAGKAHAAGLHAPYHPLEGVLAPTTTESAAGIEPACPAWKAGACDHSATQT